MATSFGSARHRQDRRYASKSGDVARANTLKGGVTTSSGFAHHRQDRRYTSKFRHVARAATLKVAWPPHLVSPATAKIDGMRPSLGTSHELLR